MKSLFFVQGKFSTSYLIDLSATSGSLQQMPFHGIIDGCIGALGFTKLASGWEQDARLTGILSGKQIFLKQRWRNTHANFIYPNPNQPRRNARKLHPAFDKFYVKGKPGCCTKIFLSNIKYWAENNKRLIL